MTRRTLNGVRAYNSGLLLVCGALVLLALLVGSVSTPEAPLLEASGRLGKVVRGELVVRNVYEGRIESRRVVSVASRTQGSVVVLELAEEGRRVEVGDLLVRFDTADIEADLIRQRTEVKLRSAELRKLVRGEHPMELRKLRDEIEEQRLSLSAERQYLADSVELAGEELLSPAELAQQRAKVDGVERRVRALESSLELTETYLHPMAVERAEAMLSGATEELERTQRRLAGGTILAPTAGIVVYQPLHLSGEYRSVRVGDSVYSNQPFLRMLDFSDLVVHVAVPEAELGGVRPGNDVLVQLTSFPELRLPGTVEHISEIAQTLPDRPAWQRYFRATLRVNGTDDHLRPGMSAVCQVVAYYEENALLIPRRAVRYIDGIATATVVVDGERRQRSLRLGEAGETHYQVKEGVELGDSVVLQ